MESIPDKEERGGPDSPSRGLTAGSGAGVLGEGEQTSGVRSMSETMLVVVGAEL